MKKLMSILLAISLILMCAASAETVGTRRIILMTEYQQIGWGERFQLGAVDSDGNLWKYISDERGGIPFNTEQLWTWMETTDQLEPAGKLSDEVFVDIVSLIQSLEQQEVSAEPVADDAGTQTSIARRDDGEIIVLGKSGDSLYEHTDPGAQALYAHLRRLFPHVTDYDGEHLIAPAGFAKTDLMTFCGYEKLDLKALTLTAYANDCETGASVITPEWSAEDILHMQVTGKKNAVFTTGGTVSYCFEDEKGNVVAAFEFFGDLLVMKDGMYSIAR